MRTRSIVVRTLRIPLNAEFRHAAATHRTSETIIAEVRSSTGLSGFGEGCPRIYVTGETLLDAAAFLQQYGPEVIAAVDDLAGLRTWIVSNDRLIDSNPAAFCAIEMAMIDLLARERGVGAETFLEQSELAGVFRYTAVIGDVEPAIFGQQLERYWRAGFRDFKLKLSGDLPRQRAKFALLCSVNDPALRVRVDANNLWRRASECIAFLQSLDFPIFAIEEPLAAHDLSAFEEVAEALRTRIVLDESFLRLRDLGMLASNIRHWILNCRVSKLGGVIRTIATVEEARRLGIGVIVGAHVGETSLLSRAALLIAKCAGTALIAQEGAFGTRLLDRDPFEPVIMFGPAGVLRAPKDLPVARVGWGLRFDQAGIPVAAENLIRGGARLSIG